MKSAKITLSVLLFLTIPSGAEEPKSFRDMQWKFLEQSQRRLRLL